MNELDFQITSVERLDAVPTVKDIVHIQLGDEGWRFEVLWSTGQVTKVTTMAKDPQQLKRVLDHLIKKGPPRV